MQPVARPEVRSFVVGDADAPAFATLSAVTSRRLASAALALAAALSLGGCAVMSPMQTTAPYSAGDGVPVDLGGVQIRGLVVVSGAQGEPGVLAGQVINNTGEATMLAIQSARQAPLATLDAEPGSTTLGTDTQVEIGPVDAIPGSMLPLIIATAAGGQASVSVPVLSPTGYYESLTPSMTETTAVTETTTETVTETPTATETASE